MGVWIETNHRKHFDMLRLVTPFVGVWIETPVNEIFALLEQCHTLRGCVD